MEVVAHRGANREAPENSWEAFQRSIDIGADRIELDVLLTADNHVVVMHDVDLVRTTGHAADVGKTTRQEIEKLKLPNGEAVPFLDQVLATGMLKDIELNIEMKGPDLALADGVMALLQGDQYRDKVIISSAEIEPMSHIADHCPDIKLACLHGRYFLWPYFGHYAPQVFMQRVRSTVIHPHTSLVTEQFMDQARVRGWKVVPFCSFRSPEDYDRETLWSNMYMLGVDGLCTNYPRELKDWYQQVRIHGNPAA